MSYWFETRHTVVCPYGIQTLLHIFRIARYYYSMKRILLTIMLLVSAASLYGQGTPSEGKDYYLGFIYPSYNTVIPAFSAGFFRIYAIVSSFQDNTAYVSYFNDNGVEEAAQPDRKHTSELQSQ